MTRRELNQIYSLRHELAMWKKKEEEIRETIQAKGQVITGMPFQNTGEVSDPTFQFVDRLVTIRSDIMTIEANIEMKIAEIDEFILTLDDSLMRQIIMYRCEKCYPWEKVARLIGCGTSAESCRKAFERKFPN